MENVHIAKLDHQRHVKLDEFLIHVDHVGGSLDLLESRHVELEFF